MKRGSLLLATGLVFGFAGLLRADPVDGDLFFTTFAGGPNIHKVHFDFDGTDFVLGGPVNIATTSGADGIVFAPDGDLLVGGQGNAVHKVKTDGSSQTTVDAGGIPVFHLAVDPTGTKVWGSSIPGDLSEVPLTPFAGGTAHDVVGDDGVLTSLAFAPDGRVFYTSSGSGGFGSVGTIDLTTFTTTQLLAGVPAAHGMVFDPLTGDLILFGSTHLTQLDIGGVVPVVVSDLDFPGLNFDQGTVDGDGHLFGASNTGDLVFIDYGATLLIGDLSNFSETNFLAAALDDVAPLVGPGAPPPVPEPATILLLGLGAASALGLRRRKA